MKQPLSAAELDDLVAGLIKLSRNIGWCWDQEAQDIFQELSPRGWQNLYHNAVAVLREVSDYELRVHLQDTGFAQRVRNVLKDFDCYLNQKNTWGHANAPGLLKNPVAYFSAEFGFHESLPISAGGLGILAGDHAKSASDLGLGFVGISLFYREGYFQQAIDSNNWQTEFYNLIDPQNAPVEPVLDEKGQPLVLEVEVDLNRVFFKAWRINVGRVPVYLLDANHPDNAQHFRDLTARVYGGDSTMRVMQEILLGIGGVRLLRRLGVAPSVFHMNEGHAAFLTLELIREKMDKGKNFTEACAATKAECIFTTHTPVEAGHDRFSQGLMDYALQQYRQKLNVPFEDILGLGRVDPKNPQEPFCMTVLALKLSRAANGVSELHGQVSRQMWQPLFPNLPVEKVPIGHITNGIHMLGWMKGSVRKFWRDRLTNDQDEATKMWHEKFGHDWAAAINSLEFWEKMADPSFVSDEELWALRYRERREMIEFIRRRSLYTSSRVSAGDFIRFDHLLNPDALTIGFARRFATYKRAPLIFQQFDNIVKLCQDKNRPIQFIFAGKAHPRDDDGKRFIQQIIHLSKHSALSDYLVFVENYDVHVARQMVSGCDIWLNNPRRPLEASGTSGMKAGCHGCLNLSILDGWWREGYDGTNGFAIGEDSQPDKIEEQDRLDSANLYKTLTEQVVPMFFDRDSNGIPRKWIQRIRRAMVTLVPQFTTDRMVKEYAPELLPDEIAGIFNAFDKGFKINWKAASSSSSFHVLSAMTYLQKLAADTANQFTKTYGRPPRWIVAAPGRVNLIGEHTDYNDGFVLPTAIERYAVMAADKATDNKNVIQIRDVCDVEPAMIDLSVPLKPGTPKWSNYPRGVVAGFLKRDLNPGGLDVLLNSTVPLGSGLSSSASLEVCTATLVEAVTGRTIPPVEKALLCQKAEHEFAGVPCGIMDQFISVMGRQNNLLLLDCRSHQTELVPMNDPAVSLLITNTNVKHELANGEYAQRRAQCEAAVKVLGVESLRDATPEMLENAKAKMDDVVFRRARHVIGEIERTIHAAEGLKASNWPAVGQLMYASHQSLRDDYEVSCKELDAIVEIAEAIGIKGGIFGCRMTGGGFGGCTIALVKTEQIEAISAKIAADYKKNTGIEATIFVTRPAAGATIVKG